MSEILVNTIKIADGTGGLTVPTTAGNIVTTGGATFTGAVTGTDLTLSGGVYLGGTGSANYLDDYEEGTWTPTAEQGGNSITTTLANYTKVGRIVHLIFYINVINSPNSDHIRIAGLPFQVATNAYAVNFFGSSGKVGYVRAQSATSRINVYRFNSSGERVDYVGTDLTSHILGTLTYETDA